MAIRDLLWACPGCAAFSSLRAGKRRTNVCDSCGTRFRRAEGATIRAEFPDGRTETLAATEWLRRLPLIESRYPTDNEEALGPEPVGVKTIQRFRPVYEGPELFGWAEQMSSRVQAAATLTATTLVLRHADREEVTPLEQILSIQLTSSSLQITRRDRPLVALRFRNASIRLWERVLQIRVANAYRRDGRGEIVEYQPVIRTGRQAPAAASAARPMPDPEPLNLGPFEQSLADRGTERPRMVYRTCAWIVRTAWRRFGRFEIHGFENIPVRGPFLLVCNHQSDLDPALIQSIIPRPVYAVAKSGLFSAPVIGWVLRRLHCIPVRRYQVDPQSVRTALRLISRGRGVAIYIEGERSWDGRLQDYRSGTIRLALRAGVPVIPVAITGTYDASPRWDTRIRPGPVTIQFLQPLLFPKLDRRFDRERELSTVAAIIMTRLADALGEASGE
jgi:1-acyl-sn-glycerol-3-phosphate acyltransferase